MKLFFKNLFILALILLPASKAPAAVIFSTSFSDPVSAGDPVTLTYSIDNSTELDPFLVTFFTHNLNAIIPGLAATSLPAEPLGSGSTISGTTFLIILGGSVPAGDIATFDVELSVPGGVADGTYPSTTSSLSGNVGGAVTIDPAVSGLTVGPVPEPSAISLCMAAGILGILGCRRRSHTA